MFLFSLFLFVKSTTTSIDYTSFVTKMISESDTNKIIYNRNLLSLINSRFVIPLRAFDDTIYYPLEMSEMSEKYKSSILKETDDFYQINSFEKKISINDMNGKILGILGRSRNLVISVRDYKNNEENLNLLKAVCKDTDSFVTIIPASLSAVVGMLVNDVEVQKYCIISVVGNVTVCTIYEITASDKSVNIKTLFSEEYKNFGESQFDNIIYKHVKSSLQKRGDKNLVIIPTFDEYVYKDSDLFLDISGICLEIKKNINFSVSNRPTEEEVAISKNDKDVKKVIENLNWNFDEIKNDLFESVNSKQMAEFTNKILEKCAEYGIKKKYLISTYNDTLINRILNLDNLSNIQDTFILKGGLKYVQSRHITSKKQIISDDPRICEGNTLFNNSMFYLEEEIKLKNNFISKIQEIKAKEGKYFEFLSDDALEKIERFINLDPDVNNLKLEDVKKFFAILKELDYKNQKTKNDKLTRPDQIRKLEDIIEKVNKVKEERNEVWTNVLEKKLTECKTFLDDNRKNYEVFGSDFVEKAYTLEGILDSSIRSFEQRKAAELAAEEKKKMAELEENKKAAEIVEEENKEAAELEESKKAAEIVEGENKKTADGENKKAAETVEEENKQSFNNQLKGDNPFGATFPDFSKLVSSPEKLKLLQEEFGRYLGKENIKNFLNKSTVEKKHNDNPEKQNASERDDNRDL